MPKRTDIQSILVIGAGPIVIGQAAEFDYSGVQAVKALKAEGYRVILVNSNPATIMTDPELAHATYIEPLRLEFLEKIIAQERPDAVLATVGGQTALNLAMELAETGVLDRYGARLLGADPQVIALAEDRELFRQAMAQAGLETPHSRTVANVDAGLAFAQEVGYPILVRPSFTLGGSGGGIAYDEGELRLKLDRGLRASPVHTALVEESVLGWKEYELEVMRDAAGNFVVICTIENLDPMGVHTGDSITVAPSQTLTDKEYQRLRDMARLVMDQVGVTTGGSNVQFAVNPQDGRALVIEMNPRVSRSSALASKATGFPIAKIAALLAVGYTLDEIRNDITRVTVASFEPSLDYVVVKIPRWDMVKFPGVDPVLGPQMKSVGEVMAMGRTFPEALQKAIRGLEIDRDGLSPQPEDALPQEWRERLATPHPERLFLVYQALLAGKGPGLVARLSGYDPWFVHQLSRVAGLEQTLRGMTLDELDDALLRQAKRLGFGDAQLARILAQPVSEVALREQRQALAVQPTYLRVDTCAAEFQAFTPYLYSSYEAADEAEATEQPKAIILGGGPNRIGQGIEFDYCCCHAAFALADLGYETVMVNCNPETVSTDYDTSHRLYFEPLTFEDVQNVIQREAESGASLGVILHYGGQTPLKLAHPLEAAGVPLWGAPPEAIDRAEDRERFAALLEELGIPAPAHGVAASLEEARQVAARIGYPVMVRPSYVLGGRAMAIIDDEPQLVRYLAQAVAASPAHPLFIDEYLEDAVEVDVDAIGDGQRVVIGGIMQHIEAAGIHSGDSACVLPPFKVSYFHLNIIREYTTRLGLALGIRGLMNVQYAIKDDVVYVLEVNPRASRTVPFVSKATGAPLAKLGAQVMAGRSLEQLGFVEEPSVPGFFVKEAVLPFRKFPEVDAMLGPEMRSTGEVMGHAADFGQAFAKAQAAAGMPLPTEGAVLITVNDFDKGAGAKIARDLHRLGFQLLATPGTAAYLQRVGLPVTRLNKVSSGSPHVVDAIRAGQVHMIINTPLGKGSRADGRLIRQAAYQFGAPLITTLSAASAAVAGIRAMRRQEWRVRSLQSLAAPSAQEAR